VGQSPVLPGDALRGIHVLVVDDDPDARDLLRSILSYAGALVAVVSSAPGALAYTRRLVPNVVVCDIVMAEHDGYWLVEQLRPGNGAGVAGIPVIAVTAFPAAHSRTRALETGFSAYLPKPIDPSELCRIVRSVGQARPR
jgi:CheY-like chemotaxis protein